MNIISKLAVCSFWSLFGVLAALENVHKPLYRDPSDDSLQIHTASFHRCSINSSLILVRLTVALEQPNIPYL